MNIKFTMFLFLFKSKYRVKRTFSSAQYLFSVLFVINLLSLARGDAAELANCDKGCYNGDCVHVEASVAAQGAGRGQGEGGGGGGGYRCRCWEGWRGERCELCGGKVKLREDGAQTWLAEAVGNYTTNMKCTWVVEAARPDSRIRLHIRDFETECGWDHLYIWDGDNIFTGLQVRFSTI